MHSRLPSKSPKKQEEEEDPSSTADLLSHSLPTLSDGCGCYPVSDSAIEGTVVMLVVVGCRQL